jgi:hypothetical protein
MKTKYIFLSTLVLVAVTSAWASEPNELERLRAEKTQLKRDLGAKTVFVLECEAMRKANIKLREENQQLKGELVKMIREKQERDKLLKEQEPIAKLRFEMDIYSKALTNANVQLPDLAKIEKDYVFRSSIQKEFKKPLSVGQVAYLQNDKPQVQQVLDERNVLVLLQKKMPRPAIYPTSGVYEHASYRSMESITQQPPDTSPLVADVIVWITGVSTVGFTNGTDFVTDKPFVVKGTKKYTTALGDNTVFALEPVKVFPD